MSNTFGQIFKVHTFGESHGKAIGAVVDGCPAGVKFNLSLLQMHLAKRRPGQSIISTDRNEADMPTLLSGVFDGITTGAPIAIIIANNDTKSADYAHLKDTFRPGHADYTNQEKYGTRDYNGGGRSSARTTAAWVIGGAVAAMMLADENIELAAYVYQIHQIQLAKEPTWLSIKNMDNIVRCPDSNLAKQMENAIISAKESGDSLGGVIACKIKNLPAGMGEPQSNKLQAQLAHAMMSINATKGFEYGAGFKSAAYFGSEFNDEIIAKTAIGISTKTNNSGGILGGISNGEEIDFRVAFKPTATIVKTQNTIDQMGEKTTISGTGRHDPCVLPRAVAIVEAMTWLTLADAWLLKRLNKMN